MNAQRLEEIRARLEATRSVSWLPLENYSIIAQQQQDIADLLDDNDVLRARVAELEREHKRVLMAVAEAIRPGYIDVEEYYKEDEDE